MDNNLPQSIAESDELRLGHMVEDFVHTYGSRDPRVRQDFRIRLWVLLSKAQRTAQAPLIDVLGKMAMQSPLQLVQQSPTKEK